MPACRAPFNFRGQKAHDQVLLAIDFQGLAGGALSGQAGWTANPPTDPFDVSPGDGIAPPTLAARNTHDLDGLDLAAGWVIEFDLTISVTAATDCEFTVRIFDGATTWPLSLVTDGFLDDVLVGDDLSQTGFTLTFGTRHTIRITHAPGATNNVFWSLDGTPVADLIADYTTAAPSVSIVLDGNIHAGGGITTHTLSVTQTA